MIVRMEQVIQLQAYEPLRYSIEVSEVDVVGLDQWPWDRRHDYLHFKAYERILQFRVLHNHMSIEQARSFLQEMRDKLDLAGMEAELGGLCSFRGETTMEGVLANGG